MCGRSWRRLRWPRSRRLIRPCRDHRVTSPPTSRNRLETGRGPPSCSSNPGAIRCGAARWPPPPVRCSGPPLWPARAGCGMTRWRCWSRRSPWRGAELANLALWRLRALHELGTIELFEQAGTSRLGQARHIAGELGALSTAAVLDIQLAAGCLFRFNPEAGEEHAASALAMAERLRL